MIIRDLYNFFYSDFLQISKTNSNTFFLHNFEGKKEFSEIFVFARVVLHQIKTAVFEEYDNKRLLRRLYLSPGEESARFLEGLKRFFEKQRHQVEKMRVCLQNFKKFVDLSKANAKFKAEQNTELMEITKIEEEETPTPHSLFTALSSKLFGTNHLRNILKLFTLTEALRDHAHYKTKTPNFIHFLIYLIFVGVPESRIVISLKIMGEIKNDNFLEIVNEIIDSNF